AVLNLALPVLYLHPLYWWLKGRVRIAAELVADDWAARFTGKEAYALEMIALARSCGRVPLPLAGAAGLFTSSSQFYRRMQMLLAREAPLATRPAAKWRWSVFSVVALVVALLTAAAGLQPAAGRPAQGNESAATPADSKAGDDALPAGEGSRTSGRRVPALVDLPLVGRLFEIPDE